MPALRRSICAMSPESPSATVVPSGDHAGLPTNTSRPARPVGVSAVAEPPAEETTKACSGLLGSSKARRDPSGDHAGSLPADPFAVTYWSPLPSALTTAILPWSVNAIRSPRGDHR